MDKLLHEDNSGSGLLAPLLMEPLNAQLMVYQKAPGQGGITLVKTIPLLENSQLVPTLSEHSLSTTIAHLYSPSAHPIPDQTLARMPPFLHRHAQKQITYPLEKLAKALLRQGGQMRVRRARARATTILDKAWEEWNSTNQQKETSKKRSRDANDREMRWKARSCSVAEAEDVDDNYKREIQKQESSRDNGSGVEFRETGRIYKRQRDH